MNLPIYRAKKIDINDYVEGYYKPEDSVSQLFVNRKAGNYIMTLVSDYDYRDCEIDPTTLAIHFPDMLDSQGNKIFASLSEDGKGGDIIEWTIFPSDTQQQIIKGTPYYSGHSVFKITNRMEMMWHSLVPHRKSKVIGIQE